MWQKEISAQADGRVSISNQEIETSASGRAGKCPDKQYRKPVEHTAN